MHTINKAGWNQILLETVRVGHFRYPTGDKGSKKESYTWQQLT